MTATSDRSAFLATLTADPTDRTTRLVFADWLAEHGTPDDAATEALLRSDADIAVEGWRQRVLALPYYRLTLRCEGGAATDEIHAAEPTRDECDELAADWTREGEWGDEGCEVSYGWSLVRVAAEGEEDVADGSGTVEIDPDHAALIGRAVGRWGAAADRLCGTDPDDHDWTSEGEGGCRENPGVWSAGGTAMRYASHCRTCGLSRREMTCGSQRNPGDHDTTEYAMPDGWCVECQSAACDCESDEE